MSPAAAKEFVAASTSPFEIGVRVVRCNSPKDSIVPDGAEGIIREVLQADNGELGYIVYFKASLLHGAPAGVEGHAPVFCAGSRLRVKV